MGYGYQERDLDKSIIDWSGLTKTISDNLVKEANRRKDLKAEIEKTQQEELQALSKYEQGLDPSANAWVMQMAQQSVDFKKQNHKLMKAGLRSVNDSNLVSQNVMDGWSDLNSSLKSYNETYKKFVEKDGKGNQFILQEMADFVDLKNKRMVYDPNTGMPFLADIDSITGEIDQNSLRPVRAFNNIQAQEFEVVDVEAETKALASDTAAVEIAINSTSSIENARLHPLYTQFRDNAVKSILSSDQKTASVLMDYLNLDPTKDPNAKSGTVQYQRIKDYDDKGLPVIENITREIGQVQMEYVNGVLTPKLTEEQKKLAEDAVIASLENKLPFKSTKKYVAPPRPPAGDAKNKNIASLIENFVSRGDFSSLQSALSEKGFVGSKAPDKDGVLRLIDASGNEYKVNTKDRNAQQVGEEIAGHVGVGKFFKDRGVKGILSKSVLDPTNSSKYNVFVTASTKFDTQTNRTNITKKLEDSMGGPLSGNEKGQEIANRIQNLVGGAANISFVPGTNNITVNGKDIQGGVDNLSLVLNAVDNLNKTQGENPLNASNRKK